MPYFTMSQLFVVAPYELDAKERQRIDNFLMILEESGVGEIVEKASFVDHSKGGRISYNPYHLFSTIIYCFSKVIITARKIEEMIKFDLRCIYLMSAETPSYVTITKFLNNVVVKEQHKIFTTIISHVILKYNIDINDCYLDGTKIEANANKYKFVWKPTTFHKKLDEKVKLLLLEYFKITDNKVHFVAKEIAEYLQILRERIVDIQGEIKPRKKGVKHSKLEKDYYLLTSYMLKALEYEEKEDICGTDRNSYYHTDHDATAMCLKEDYYSGLGSNMHAGYNVQFIVSKGIIMDYYVSQDRNDFYAFIPALKIFFNDYGYFPTNLCADSGYGSYENYKFLKDNLINNYVKFLNWRKEMDGKSVPLYQIKNDQVYCLNGKALKELKRSESSVHPRRKSNKIYVVEGCNYCKFKRYCQRNLKKKTNIRYFETNIDLIKFQSEARSNLLTAKGIEMRINRSAQVKGSFGVVKQDMSFERFSRRGLESVSLEMMLVCLGYNIRKIFKLIDGNAKLNYWIAPPDLCDEKMPEINIKKLLYSKPKNKGKNSALRKSYKHTKRG